MMKVFVAGATGAIGSRLVALLLTRGHRVFGMTRTFDGSRRLSRMGAIPMRCDVFDAAALNNAVVAAHPDAVVHQLTDLPRGLDPSRMEVAIQRNARIRSEGTRNLVSAAVSARAAHLVAQSIAWAYAPAAKPFSEESPLDDGAQGLRAISIGGVMALEHAVLHTPGIRGTVLRYGQIYGPGTGSDDASGKSVPLHVDAAAWAAVLAVESARDGVFNIAGPNPDVSTDRAVRELVWNADMRLPPAAEDLAGHS